MSLLRRLCTALVAALVFMTGAAVARAQAILEATLMEVRLGQAASLALRGEREGERLWLPLGELAAGLELEIVTRSATRVTLRRWPSRDLLVFDRDSAGVRIGGARIAAPASAIRSSDGELLVDVALLRAVLRTSFEVSFSDLMIAVPVIDSLPIGRRVAREQARARLLTREAAGRPGAVAPLARPIADGAVVDYTLTAPLTGTQRGMGWSTALGLDVLGGSLEVSTGAVPGGTRLPTLSSWTGVWREGRKLSQVRLGDGLGSGPAPRLGRGVMLTNAPYLRPALFGLQTLRGDLPPGWTIEAYRNGELVAVDTVGRGSGYQLQLPVLYGENPVDLLAVGPFGQTRSLSQTVRIGGDLLARHRSEYGVSAAQCRLRQQCIAAGTFDFRLGLTDRWTMRLGLDGVARDTVGWRQAPYVSVSGMPFSQLTLQLDAAAQSRTRVAMNIEPSQRLRLSMEQSWFSANPIDPLLASRRLSQSSLYAYWRSLDTRQSSLEASLDRSAFIGGGGLTRARVGYGTQTTGLRLQPYVSHDQSTRGGFTQTALGFEATVLPDGGRGKYLGSSLLRLIGEVDRRGEAVRRAMTLSMPLPSQFRMDAGVALQRGVRGPLATLTMSRDLNAMRSYTSATMSQGAAAATQSVQGSALLARGTRRPQFVPGPSLQRTGVTGIVFLDRNANGTRDRGEPALEGVQVQVGTGWSLSDAEGRYRVWDLAPFVPMPVSVDSTTMPSPLWIPVIRHASIEAGPNRFEPLDIPVVAGGVVEGRVSWVRDGATSLPPIPLLLMNAAGIIVARTSTFSDGEFVLFGVRPGALTVRIDPAWLAAQGLNGGVTQSIVLPASDDGATVRVPAITITARPSVDQCVLRPGTRCGSADDDLRQRGGEDGVGLRQTDFEADELRTVAVNQRQPQLAPLAVASSRQLLAGDAHHGAIRAPPIDGDGPRAAPLDIDRELRTTGGARHGSEREWLAHDLGAGADRRLLTVGVARKKHRGAEERGRAEAPEVSVHAVKSRQAAIGARAPRLRAHSMPAAVLHRKRTAAVTHSEAAAPAVAPGAGVHWRASLNLPDLTAAALSVAVTMPPPSSVTLTGDELSAQLQRTELAMGRDTEQRSRTRDQF